MPVVLLEATYHAQKQRNQDLSHSRFANSVRSMLKAQDVLVLLKLVASPDPEPSFNRLAVELDRSPSEVHQAIQRARHAGLLTTEARKVGKHGKFVTSHALLEFLVHGLKYVFPAERGGETRGMPTAHAAPPLAQKFAHAANRELPPVWPDPEGNVRGLEFSPLYRSAPSAAKRDVELYRLLALVDALRGGRARERQLAQRELTKCLGREQPVAE